MKAYKTDYGMETIYRCENCYEEFDEKALAKKCCSWACSNCETGYDNKAEANQCCKD